MKKPSPIKLAVTGRPGSGKTTLCRRLIEALDLEVGGILTQELRNEKGRRLGFELLDLSSGRKGVLSHVHFKAGPRVGRYVVSLADIERVAIPALERAVQEAELVIIDEIAPMELKSSAFVESARRAIESDCSLLVTFKQRLAHPLVQQVRRVFQVRQLSEANREELFEELNSLFGGLDFKRRI